MTDIRDRLLASANACAGEDRLDLMEQYQVEMAAIAEIERLRSGNAAEKVILQIEQISDNCVNAEVYTAEDALNHLQGIRNIIKGFRAPVGGAPNPAAPDASTRDRPLRE